MKRLLSIVCILALLAGLMPAAYAADETSYTYLGDLYTLSSDNDLNTYVFTDAEARTENISLHLVHASGTGDALTFAIPASSVLGMNFGGYGSKGYTHFQFYAKGTLPESASVQVYWSNGQVNNTVTTEDATRWKVGEADENGWQRVDITVPCIPGNPGSYGGNAGLNFRITGAADFYMDDVAVEYEKYNSAGIAQGTVSGLLDSSDPSFENVSVPSIEESWEDIEYADEDKESLNLLNDTFTVSSDSSENWGAFREDEAYDGDVSLHLVHPSTNTDKLTLQIGNSTSALQNIPSGYATSMTGTLKFYAKGHIPETANFVIGLTNGRLTYSVDRSAWIIGEEDADGWKLVTVSGTGTYVSGFYGGHVNAYLNISSQADFYMDDVTIDWAQGGSSGELLEYYGHDGSFEDVFRVVEWDDAEYSFDEKKSMMIGSGMYTVSSPNAENWGAFRMDDAYEGDVSLHLVHPKTNEDTITLKIGKSNAELQSVPSSSTTSATAKLAFYAKGNLPDNAVLRITMTNGKFTYDVSRELWSVGEADENGWYKVEISGTGTYSGGFYGGYLDAFLDIRSQADFYMDNLSLEWTQGGNSGELLSVHEPSFEDAEDVVVKEQDYVPSNLYVYPTDTSLMLSWRNPKSNSLKSVKLYDITDGTETDITEEFAVAQESGVNFNMIIKDIEKGISKYFMVVSTFEDHDDTYFTFGGKIETASYPAVSGWGRETYTNVLGYCPIKPYLYTGEAHSGKASLRVISNQTAPTPGNNYVTFMASADVSQDKNYQFSFWVKGEKGTMGFYNNWTAIDGKNGYSIPESGLDEWHREVLTLTAPQSKIIRLNFERGSGYFLVDDVELFELDADGNPIGDNLLPNGGFESGIDASNVPTSITGVKVSDDTPEVINLSWNNISDAGSRVNVYKKIGDEYIPVAVVLNDRNNIDIKGLVCDEESILAVSVTNSADIESDKYDVVVVPKAKAYVVKNVRLTKGISVLENLESGNLKVKADVKNNHMGSGFTAELIAVLYKDGVLQNVFADGTTEIPELATFNSAEEIEVSVNIPDLSEGEYELKVYIWDSFEEGKVLAPVVLMTE